MTEFCQDPNNNKRKDLLLSIVKYIDKEVEIGSFCMGTTLGGGGGYSTQLQSGYLFHASGI